jgi:hypothetical protein
MLVNVLMIGGVVLGGAAIPALLFAVFENEAQLVSIVGLLLGGLMVLAALYLTPTPFSPDYIMAMRMLAGFAAATFVFRRR